MILGALEAVVNPQACDKSAFSFSSKIEVLYRELVSKYGSADYCPLRSRLALHINLFNPQSTSYFKNLLSDDEPDDFISKVNHYIIIGEFRKAQNLPEKDFRAVVNEKLSESARAMLYDELRYFIKFYSYVYELDIY